MHLSPGMKITPPRFPPYLYSQTQRLLQRLNDLGETFLYKSSRIVQHNQPYKLEGVPSFLRSLLGGNGLGRAFPAGVRPGSPWRGDAFLLPHYSVDHSVVLRWRLNWVDTTVFVTERRSSILIDLLIEFSHKLISKIQPMVTQELRSPKKNYECVKTTTN